MNCKFCKYFKKVMARRKYMSAYLKKRRATIKNIDKALNV